MGQVGHGHDRAGRLVGGEEAGLHLVYGVHVHDVAHEDGEADDIVQVVADTCHDGLDVLEALLGLLGDAAGYDGAGRRVQRQLGRQVVVVAEGHGLGIQRALRSILGVAGHHHIGIAHGYLPR